MIRGALLDEHYHAWWPEVLAAAIPDFDFRYVGGTDAPPRGSKDPELLLWLEENQFILLTNNRASMPIHLADHIAIGRHVPGIFIVPKSIEFSRLIEALQLIYGASLPGEFADSIRFLPYDWQR